MFSDTSIVSSKADLILEGFSIEEASDWIQKAIKHPGKLRADLGLSDDENIYDVPITKLISYAKGSVENKKRVLLLKTLLRNRPGKRTPKENEFFNNLNKALTEL